MEFPSPQPTSIQSILVEEPFVQPIENWPKSVFPKFFNVINDLLKILNNGKNDSTNQNVLEIVHRPIDEWLYALNEPKDSTFKLFLFSRCSSLFFSTSLSCFFLKQQGHHGLLERLCFLCPEMTKKSNLFVSLFFDLNLLNFLLRSRCLKLCRLNSPVDRVDFLTGIALVSFCLFFIIFGLFDDYLITH